MNTIPTPLSWVEISRSAFDHNVTQYKNALGNTALAAVIKSDAYGHKQELVAQLCEQNKDVAQLCVSNLSEALFLRNQDITKPILVLGHLDHDLEVVINKNIAFMCYEKDLLDQANAIGTRHSKKINIHLKIDTGLSRFGLLPEEATSFIRYAQTLPFINLQGIFTHFAQSQHEDQTFTLKQHNLFAQLLQELESFDIRIPLRHCANSAAATILRDNFCTMARVGIGLYGIWPSESVKQNTQILYPDFDLRPVATWKTTISGIRTIPAGTTIGYDRTFTTQRETRVALLPVGYYEGYHRRYSNNGTVIVHDTTAPIIGRVCMNITMADVTHIPQASKGDQVYLLANKPGITPHELAHRIQSFNPREILTQIQGNVPRIITQ